MDIQQIRRKAREIEAVENSVRTDVPFLRGATESGGKKLNAIAKKYIKKGLIVTLDWVDEIFDIIKESNPQSMGMNYAYLSPEITKHGNHTHIKAPDYGSSNRDFERIFGTAVVAKMDEATKKLLMSLMDKPGVDPGKSSAIFQDLYFDTVITAGDDAYRAALEAWEKMPQSWKDANPFTGNKTTFFDKDIGWIQRMYENGYKEVQSLGRNTLNKVKNLILAMQLQDEPLSMREMVKELSTIMKKSAPYQIKRLVRTEMVGAADKEEYERYQEMGVEHVRISVGSDACPICKNYKEYNKGFYLNTQAPDIPEDTHPNCRCSFVAVFGLPKGVSKNGNEKDARAELNEE